MLRKVPTGISLFRGTMAVSTLWPRRRTNLTWLPLWLASTNPAASSRRLISRKGSGLSRPNLDLDHANLRRASGSRRFKVQFQRFLQVAQGFFFAFALTGDIDFETLRDIPVPFTPDSRGEWSLHVHILSQDGEPPHAYFTGSIQSKRCAP